jgi:hypothetical protein
MTNHDIKTLPIAVRVFPETPTAVRHGGPGNFWMEPEGILVIHTEARREAPQKLRLGIYRFIVDGRCVEEGFFYGDLSKAELRLLKNYVARYPAETVKGGVKELRLLTRREFLDLFWKLAYKARCLVVGFDLPFQLSRIAFHSAPARDFFAGGFSLGLWSYFDDKGRERVDRFRSRVRVKYVDRKSSLIGFSTRNSPDEEDLVPEGSPTGDPNPGYKFPGHFVDLRTLAFALSDEVHSLEDACQAFGVKYGTKRTS